MVLPLTPLQVVAQCELPQLGRLTAPQSTTDHFSHTIGISGDTVLIGRSPGTGGGGSESCYLFQTTNGAWELLATLTASDAALGDEFGRSVAIDGDTAVISARLDDDDGNASGAAYVFRKVSGTWQEIAKLTASDAAPGGEFGWDVAIDASTILVSGGVYDNTASIVYVFEEIAGQWQEVAKLSVDGPAAVTTFGYDLSIDGATLVVGAPLVSTSNHGPGAAYVFRKINGVWSPTATLSASDGASQDQFGASVSISGDHIAVGTILAQAAYVYENIAGTWQETAAIPGPSTGVTTRFGSCVAISADDLVIGSPTEGGIGLDGESGAAYLYRRNGGVWESVSRITSDPHETRGWFGGSVSISGDLAAIGAPGHAALQPNNRSAYIIQLSLSNDDCNANSIADECELVDNDCNADGIPDDCQLLNNDCNANGVPDECDVVVNDCNANGVPDECELEGNDCNNNGLPDECDLEDNDCNGNGVPNECEPFIDCNGNGIQDDCDLATPPFASQIILSSDIRTYDNFGTAVAVAGDTFVVGATGDDDGGDNSGSVYVFQRDGSEWVQIDKLTASDRAAGDRFGNAIATAGGLMIVGARSEDGAAVDSGAAYIFEWVSDHWEEIAKLTASDAAASDEFGFSVAIDGDTAVVGARLADVAALDSGAAYVFRKVDGAWQEIEKLLPSESYVRGSFGYSVAIQGSDIVIGAPSQGIETAAFVFHDIAGQWTEVALLRSVTTSGFNSFGQSVDIDNGVIVVGDPQASQNGDNSGAVVIFEEVNAVWTETQMILAQNENQSTALGGKVKLVDDTLVICGAGVVSENGDRGLAFVFGRTADGWRELGVASHPNAADSGGFSSGVDFQDDILVVGTGESSPPSIGHTGAAFIVDLRPVEKDCNGNTIPDSCEIASGAAMDCNENGIPDDCETLANDCNANGVPDDCELAENDCNNNGKLDDCDLAGGVVRDLGRIRAFDGQPGEQFGSSVAVDGETAIVGAQLAHDAMGVHGGAAYVFQLAEGHWRPGQKLLAPIIGSFDLFGASVAIDGAVAIIGAPLTDSESANNTGAAYIFSDPGDGHWVETARLTIADGLEGDQFGTSVAIDGDTVVVGTHWVDTGAPGAGAAYVFRRIDGVWTRVATLAAPDPVDLDLFGISVAISGDTIIVGASQGPPVLDRAQPGRAFIFENVAGVWTYAATLTANDGEDHDAFGIVVDIDGDTAAVSAIRDDTLGLNAGSVYVFRRIAGQWAEIAKIRNAQALMTWNLGASVAISGQTIAASAHNAGLTGTETAIFLYREISGVWTPTDTIREPGQGVSEAYGEKIALDGASLVAGAFNATVNGVRTGAAFTYDIDSASRDCDADSIPDECESQLADIAAFIDAVIAASQDANDLCRFDLDRNGSLDSRDIQNFARQLLIE